MKRRLNICARQSRPTTNSSCATTWPTFRRSNDPQTYKIAVGGDGANGTAELTLDDLKKMPAVEVVAVNQCSGNRRGLSNPHVAGVEWGYGAMGCARWKGARLKDILDKVGVKNETIEVGFNGADGPVVDKTPDFIKSLPFGRRWMSTPSSPTR